MEEIETYRDHFNIEPVKVTDKNHPSKRRLESLSGTLKACGEALKIKRKHTWEIF